MLDSGAPVRSPADSDVHHNDSLSFSYRFRFSWLFCCRRFVGVFRLPISYFGTAVQIVDQLMFAIGDPLDPSILPLDCSRSVSGATRC
jgi:hypothetical protein